MKEQDDKIQYGRDASAKTNMLNNQKGMTKNENTK